jgi:hypothetical protein
MAMKSKEHTWVRLLVCLLLLLPLALLFLLPAGGILAGVHWFWLLLVLCFWLMLFSIGRPDDTEIRTRTLPKKRMLIEEEQPAIVREVIDVEIAPTEAGFLAFRGKLREPADSAYRKVKSALPGTTPLLQKEDDGGTAILLPDAAPRTSGAEQPIRPWVNWLLFLFTIVTTTMAGAAYQGVDLWQKPFVGTESAAGGERDPHRVEVVSTICAIPAGGRPWGSRSRRAKRV